MQKIKIFIIVLIFILPIFSCLQIMRVSAESSQILDDAIQENLEELDLSDLEEYLKNFKFGEEEALKDRLIRYINGDSIDYSSLFLQVFEVFFQETLELFPQFACITAIALLCGVLSALQFGSTDKTLAQIIYLIAFVCILIPILSIVNECFNTAKESLYNMQNQMEILFPILLTLLIVSGGASTVAICKPSLAFLSTTMIRIISDLVFPITLIIFAFLMLNKISDDFKFAKFTLLLKSVNKWLIGLGLSIFGVFFSVQGLTAGGYDSIIKRATKYAIGNGIPIVGGFLSGGFDLAIAGSVLIKNSLGYLGVVLMIASVVKPLILLLSTTLLLRFTAAITSPFGESKISDFLSDTADVLNYFSAGILFTVFLYFLSIIVMISATEAII